MISGSYPGRDKGFFPFLTSRPVLGPTQPPSMGNKGSFLSSEASGA